MFIAGGLCYASVIGLINIAALGSLCGLNGCLLLRFDCVWWFGVVDWLDLVDFYLVVLFWWMCVGLLSLSTGGCGCSDFVVCYMVFWVVDWLLGICVLCCVSLVFGDCAIVGLVC